MNVRTRLSADETREQILEVAEEHFRRIGYGKTAVADIASTLGMSPANVYRFFPSKSAIVEAICHKLLSEGLDLLSAIAREPAPAADRLERMILTLHRFNKSHYTSERRVHDMVTAAMEENWSTIEAHFATLIRLFGEVISQGIESGEFPRQDVPVAALTLKNTISSVVHPALIASCAHLDLDNQATRLARFAIAALRAGPALPAPEPFPFSLNNSR